MRARLPTTVLGTMRQAVFVLLLGLLPLVPAHAAAGGCTKPWPAWETFKKNFISRDGRVIDGSLPDMRTTSEGQAYAMFFALVADDRDTFEQLLNWTENNLAQGDLASHLPSWVWGKVGDTGWSVLDENSATDADLWLAYDLGEAGRLWTNRRYVALSSLIANRILNTETRKVAGLGLVLLPGRTGFVDSATRARLNPSYMPLQLMRWFSVHGRDARWKTLLDSSREVILKSAHNGYAPDWVAYDDDRGFRPGSAKDKSDVGSYDAIRVYLWAGMLNPGDANYKPQLDALRPMAMFVEKHGYPPRTIDVATGDAGAAGSSGFSAAMLPFLQAEGVTGAVNTQVRRIADAPIDEHAYYDQVLSLYALGWREGLYRFAPNGNLAPRWMSSCQ